MSCHQVVVVRTMKEFLNVVLEHVRRFRGRL